MKRKSKVPWFARRRESCPECGFLTNCAFVDRKILTFNCPRCKVSLSFDDFWQDNQDKYELKADLSGEDYES